MDLIMNSLFLHVLLTFFDLVMFIENVVTENFWVQHPHLKIKTKNLINN